MLDSAKKVLAGRIETMPEEALLALLEETFPYVSPFSLHMLWGQELEPTQRMPSPPRTVCSCCLVSEH